MKNLEDEDPQKPYVIRRRLGALKKLKGFADWLYRIGPFAISIMPHAFADLEEDDVDDNILNHENVDIYLTETDKNGNRKWIDLREDSRFKNYQPILYEYVTTPTGGIVNCGDGRHIPIFQLCELIKYLHRLANLTAFR